MNNSSIVLRNWSRIMQIGAFANSKAVIETSYVTSFSLFFSDLILVIQKRSTLFLLFLFWISAIRSGGPLVAGSPYWAITKTYHILRTSRLICNILLPSQLNWIKPPRNTTNLIVLALNCNMHWRKNATKCYKLVLRLRILSLQKSGLKSWTT